MSDNRQFEARESKRLSTSGLHALVEGLLCTQAPGTDADVIDQLEALERIKSAACAVQARLADDLLTRRPATRDDTIPASLAREVALARHESPFVGRAKVDLGRALLRELPHTYLALCAGDINERRAHIIANETQHLSAEHRATADRRIASNLTGLGDKKLTHAIRRIALHLDEAGAAERHRRAMDGRHMTTRSLGNGTSRLTLIVSDLHAAAIATSLSRAADGHRESAADGHRESAATDDRSHAQRVADIAARRLAGLEQNTEENVPVAINLVLSVETLLGDSDAPAHLRGHGPIPASIARRAIALSDPLRSTLRRLFAIPDEGTLVTSESSARCFPNGLRELILTRDDLCRTPYCNATPRHGDHIVPAADHGPTAQDNGQALCAWCNYTKDRPGWSHRTTSAEFDQHEVTTTSPTGHRHRSRAPATVVPGRAHNATMEHYLSRLVLVAADYQAA